MNIWEVMKYRIFSDEALIEACRRIKELDKDQDENIAALIPEFGRHPYCESLKETFEFDTFEFCYRYTIHWLEHLRNYEGIEMRRRDDFSELWSHAFFDAEEMVLKELWKAAEQFPTEKDLADEEEERKKRVLFHPTPEEEFSEEREELLKEYRAREAQWQKEKGKSERELEEEYWTEQFVREHMEEVARGEWDEDGDEEYPNDKPPEEPIKEEDEESEEVIKERGRRWKRAKAPSDDDILF